MPKGIRRSEILVSLHRGIRVPLRVQLERALRDAIQRGRLAAGCPLPSTRVLASELELSRGLVVAVYEQLVAEGYLCANRGSATSVANRATATTPRLAMRREPLTARVPRYDLRPGRPDHALFPRRAWLSAVRRTLATAPDAALDYPDAQGAASAREVLATYLNRSRATAAVADQVVFTTGFAQGMRLVCETLKARGVRRLAVENPGHAFESGEVRESGLTLVPVPVDDSGLCVERLARLNVGGVYVTPAHQYPLGVVLSAERHAALLAWADQHDAFVVEDDYDGEYRYDREPIGALQGLASERVVYIGSSSKTLAPALRIGWVLSPSSLIAALSKAKLDADRGSSGIDQLTLAEFIERGHLDRHLRRTRLIYSRRRTLLATAIRTHLPGYPIRGIAAGLHLTLDLPRGADEAAIVREAAGRGIALHGMGSYRLRPNDGPPALLLGYCRLPESDIDEAARALTALVKQCE